MKVILFFTPAAAPALVKGYLEEISARGMPEMAALVHGLQDLGGRILVCDLCLEASDLQAEDLRDGAEFVGVISFLADTQDATRTFSFQCPVPSDLNAFCRIFFLQDPILADYFNTIDIVLSLFP